MVVQLQLPRGAASAWPRWIGGFLAAAGSRMKLGMCDLLFRVSLHIKILLKNLTLRYYACIYRFPHRWLCDCFAENGSPSAVPLCESLGLQRFIREDLGMRNATQKDKFPEVHTRAHRSHQSQLKAVDWKRFGTLLQTNSSMWKSHHLQIIFLGFPGGFPLVAKAFCHQLRAQKKIFLDELQSQKMQKDSFSQGHGGSSHTREHTHTCIYI